MGSRRRFYDEGGMVTSDPSTGQETGMELTLEGIVVIMIFFRQGPSALSGSVTIQPP